MKTSSLVDERAHLANLLEAVQPCTYFLYASASKADWPLDGQSLKQRQKDEALFEALAAFNERFAKLQDTLGAAMRHCALLMSETTAPFLKVLALFEKLDVIDSIDSWQLCRTARNLAAHDYAAAAVRHRRRIGRSVARRAPARLASETSSGRRHRRHVAVRHGRTARRHGQSPITLLGAFQ